VRAYARVIGRIGYMFDHLIGNSDVKEAIRRFIAVRRIPNSLIFAGPEGVGKKQFALEFARSIVCRQPRDHGACGECAACRRASVFEFPGPGAEGKDYDTVFFSEHPDVGMVIPFNRTLRVGSVRALESEANFRPYEASSRVFIIDDAHKMNDASSNALLKTLEEPPSTSHIFLISSKPDALLPTIRSRSQVLRFGPVPLPEIEHFLLTTHQYSQDDARLIAACSMGSVARAASLRSDEFGGRFDDAVEVLESAIVNKDLVTLLKKAEAASDSKNKRGFEDLLDILQALIHYIWSVRLDPTRTVKIDPLDRLADAADSSALAQWMRDIEDVRSALNVNINKRIAADALLARMAAP
jgi:DNA polymerase-3 subunit delta'